MEPGRWLSIGKKHQCSDDRRTTYFPADHIGCFLAHPSQGTFDSSSQRMGVNKDGGFFLVGFSQCHRVKLITQYGWIF